MAYGYFRLWRYLRLIINCFAAWTFKPIPLPGTASYSNRDVTVIIPTLANSEDFRRCLLSVAACHPHSIIVVTPKERVGAVRKLCDNLRLFDIEILGAPKANKRLQMIQGLKRVRTSITVFADDDVFWPSTFLEYSLAPFEDPNVGASGELHLHHNIAWIANREQGLFKLSNVHRIRIFGTSSVRPILNVGLLRWRQHPISTVVVAVYLGARSTFVPASYRTNTSSTTLTTRNS